MSSVIPNRKAKSEKRKGHNFSVQKGSNRESCSQCKQLATKDGEQKITKCSGGENVKQHLRLSAGLWGSVAGVLLAQAPVKAAPTQVTGVQVSQANNGVNIVLATEKGDRPQVFAINNGNTYQATIINTQLRLPQGNSFRQDNPAPGISSVEISQVEANSIRVVVAGTNGVPNGQIVPGQGQSIVLSVAGVGGTAQSAQTAPPPPPGLPLTQTAPRPAPQVRTSQNPGVLLPNPEVTITRNDRPPLPSEIQSQTNQAAPFQPRAVAPPLGDIAVSNIAPGVGNIELSSGERIPAWCCGMPQSGTF
jgi:Predicted membrane protein